MGGRWESYHEGKAARETWLRVTDCCLPYVAIVSGHSRKTCEWEVGESKQSRPVGDRALCPDTGRHEGHTLWAWAPLSCSQPQRLLAAGQVPDQRQAGQDEWKLSQGQGHERHSCMTSMPLIFHQRQARGGSQATDILNAAHADTGVFGLDGCLLYMIPLCLCVCV